jgi:DNA polymerase III subunit gamma/tau
MFATTDPEKVLPTILSRCQRFDLRRIPVTLIVKQLQHIARQEQVEVESAALHAIARGCDGGMRDAESALDQLISFCGNKIVETDVLSMYGLTAQSQLLALSQAILDGDAATALRELDTLAKTGKDLGRLLSDLLRHFRNLMIFQVTKGDLSLLEASEAEAAALGQQAAKISADAVARLMEVFSGCELNFRDAASKKILIEIALLKAIQARNAVSIDVVLKQLQALRSENPPAGGAPATPAPAFGSLKAAVAALETNTQTMAATTPPAPAPAPVVQPAPAVAPNAHATAIELSPEELEMLWAKLVESAQRASPFIRSYLLEAHPVSFTRNVLTIGFDEAVRDHVGLMDNAKNRTLLQTKMHELGHSGVQFKFVVAAPQPGRKPMALAERSASAAPNQPAAAPANGAKPKAKTTAADPAEFKNDPLIQKALEIFRGTIAEARG